MKLRVECYSGGRADERPVRFYLGERVYLAEEVIDQWYGPSDLFFKVRADDGNLFCVRANPSPKICGVWSRSAKSKDS